jgi:hypothetical protein
VVVVKGQLSGVGIEVEELAVATPVHRDLELLARLVLGEAPT